MHIGRSLVVGLFVFAAGCCTTGSSALDGAKIRSKGMETKQLKLFEMPDGAGGELARRQLVLYLKLTIQEDLARSGSSFAVPDSGKLQSYANQQIEALMPRMKRFKCFSLYNSGGRQMVRELVHLGEVAATPELASSMPAPDVILSVSASWGRYKERVHEAQVDEVHMHRVTYSYTMTDAHGQILTDAADASGVIEYGLKRGVANLVNLQTRKTEFFGGFDPSDTENVHNVFELIFTDVNRALAAKLAVAFPVTALVTGLSPSGTQFSMAAGTRNGVFNGGRVVIWVQDQGFDYVIAEAEAQATMDRSTLKVLNWNRRDPDASKIARKLQRDVSTFSNYKNRIWATTKDIPKGEEWGSVK